MSGCILKHRYELIADRIIFLLEDLPYGMKLPSIRELMARFEVSQVTIDRSLRYLVERNLLIHEEGRGYFRPDPADVFSPPLQIDYCSLLNWDASLSPLYGPMNEYLLHEIDSYACFMNMFSYESTASIDGFRKRILSNSPDAICLLACPDLSYTQVLQDLEIPYLHIFPNVFDEFGLSFFNDNYKGMLLGIEHLYDLGHRRIAFLHGQGDTHTIHQEERMEAFCEITERLGIPECCDLLRYGSYSAEQGYIAAMDLFELPENKRPTAIFANSYNAPGVYEAAREKGLSIPEDISVIGFDKLPYIEFLNPPLTAIDTCYEDMLKEVAKIIYAMAKNKKQERALIRADLKLVKGRSTTINKNDN